MATGAEVGDATLRVWGVGTGRTFRVHWMLHELGLDYESRPVQSRTGETQTEAFLALNPRGKIPVLEHGDLVLAESAAIVTHLAERFGRERGLIPEAGCDARAVHDQWCYFAMMELDATSLYVIRRHRDLAAIYGEAPHAVASCWEYFRRQVSVAEDALADRDYLMGERFAVADLLLTSCLDWAVFFGEKLSDPLEAYRQRCSARPSHAAAFRANFPPEVLAQMRAGSS